MLRADTIGKGPRTSYDQIVDLMNNAKRHRRKIARLQKVVGDLDEAAVEEGEGTEQRAASLQEIADDIKMVEEKARSMMGQVLDESELLEGLKARLSEQLLKEVLDVINAYVDPDSYQKIKESLVRRFGKGT